MKLNNIPEVRFDRLMSNLAEFAGNNKLQPWAITGVRKKRMMRFLDNIHAIVAGKVTETMRLEIHLSWHDWDTSEAFAYHSMSAQWWSHSGVIAADRLPAKMRSFAASAARSRVKFSCYYSGGSLGFSWDRK